MLTCTCRWMENSAFFSEEVLESFKFMFLNFFSFVMLGHTLKYWILNLNHLVYNVVVLLKKSVKCILISSAKVISISYASAVIFLTLDDPS